MTKSNKIDSCGCCDGISVDTPMRIFNRPGLSAISYRIGKHNDFKQSLLAKLSLSQSEGLRKLTSRSDDDFTIAFLDAFATVADVLTFYQERIANESYLQTAADLLSGQELAYLIGYHPRPGVAASTFLAFTLDNRSTQSGKEAERGMKTAENDFPNVTLPVGTRVQSVPEKDEKPQFFETIEEIIAKADWNAMPVRTSKSQSGIIPQSYVYLDGTSFNLKGGDQLMITENDSTDFRKIEKADVLEDQNRTKVILQKLSVFTTVIAVAYPMVMPVVPQYMVDLDALISLNIGSASQKLVYYDKNLTQKEANVAMQNFKTTPKGINVLVFRETANLFGYNAPAKNRYVDGEGVMKEANWTFSNDDNNKTYIYLDRVYDEVIVGDFGYVGIKIGNGSIKSFKIQSVDTVSLSRYDISGKSTRITLDDNSGVTSLYWLRQTIVYLKSENLPLSEEPIESPLAAGTSEIDLAAYYHDLIPGRHIMISGELSDLPGVVRSEAHQLDAVAKNQGNTYSTISLKNSLINNYVRDTVRINANVALATHGETVQEILGSGNAAASFQKFKLKQPPQTYVSSDDPSGATSSLEVRVNDILWQEVSTLYGHTGDETIYTIRQNSQGESVVTFGDGITGSRLPTGNQNIRATYRKGIGAAGLLNANQLSQLISKPLHLKAVNNPVATSGAQDPESVKDIKRNANLTVFTLGRIVSLLDFEDYARAFAGISKARSVWVWQEDTKTVHITIAGEDGSVVPLDSILYSNLKDSIEENLSQKTAFAIENYQPKYFTFTGSLLVDPTYEFDKVHDSVVQLVRDKYSFENREFGQSVALNELIGYIHQVPGVQAVDIDTLSEITVDGPLLTGEQPQKLLIAALTEKGSENAHPAELLIISDEPINLLEMS